MEPKVNRRPSADPRDLLGAYALGAVDAHEAAEVEALLAQDAAATAEIAALLAVAGTLTDLVEPMEPPAGLRDRIAAAALAERPAPLAANVPGWATSDGLAPRALPAAPGSAPTPVVRPEPSFWQRASVWATAAAALMLVSIGLFAWNMQLRNELATAPQVETMALSTTEHAPNATGLVKYMPQEGVIMLDVRDLPPLPDGYVYEVWLIGEGEPQPAGTFSTSSGQHAIAADRSQFTTLAVTAEPGPLGTMAPTSEPVVTASL